MGSGDGDGPMGMGSEDGDGKTKTRVLGTGTLESQAGGRAAVSDQRVDRGHLTPHATPFVTIIVGCHMSAVMTGNGSVPRIVSAWDTSPHTSAIGLGVLSDRRTSTDETYSTIYSEPSACLPLAPTSVFR